jgi:hypothetical protein
MKYAHTQIDLKAWKIVKSSSSSQLPKLASGLHCVWFGLFGLKGKRPFKLSALQFNDILVWPVPLTQVLPRPQLIFPSKTWFFGIYLNLQWQKSLLNQYLPHSESKSHQINFIKSCSSRSFQQHHRHIPISPKFSATI